MARALYGALLIVCIVALPLWSAAPLEQLRRHVVSIVALGAIGICGYVVSHDLRFRGLRVFDMGVALVLVAVVVAGPIAAFAVALAPELVHLARRRRAFLNLGFVANVVSLAGAILIGSAVRGLAGAGALGLPAVFGAGVAMLATNYLLARLVLGVVRDGESAVGLIRREFVAALPLELVAVLLGASCAVLLPAVGVCVFAAFTALAYLPQLAAAQLLRAPSVAALSVDDAAAVYRDALADEMGLARADRRLVHRIDALVQRRRLPDAPANPLGMLQDALLVSICTSRPPTQRHFSATTRTQVVLVARRWAELTARCTPALNHREALVELRRSGLAQDAPAALTAAAAIIEREAALTEHVAGVPRLHRAPLPRMLRHDVLPAALGRLAA